MRSAVVLPEPDGPTSTMNSPSCDLQVEARRRPARRCPGRSSSPARSGRQPSLASLARQLRCRARGAAAPAPPAPAPSSSSASSAAPTIGGDDGAARSDRRPDRAQPRLDRAEQPRVARLQEPAAEQHLDGLVASARAARAPRARARRSRRRAGRRSRRPRRRARPRRRRPAPARSRAVRDPPAMDAPRPARAASRAPKCAGTRLLERRPRAAPVLAARRRGQTAAKPTSWPPPQSPVISPSAGKRAVPPVRRDADAVDAGAADDGDAPAALGARRAARRRCRCRPPSRAGPAARGRAPPRRSRSSTGKSAPASNRSRDLGGAARSAPAACDDELLDHVQRASRPRWCGELAGPRTEREQLAVRARRARGRSSSCRRRRRARPAGSSGRSQHAREHALEQLLRLRPLADQRMGEQRLARP